VVDSGIWIKTEAEREIQLKQIGFENSIMSKNKWQINKSPC
jgi:hypothetical protein